MKNLDQSSERFLEQQKIIGYKSGLDPKKISKSQFAILKDLVKLPPNSKSNLSSIDEITLKYLAKKFYNERFNIHDIKNISGDISKFYISVNDTKEDVNRKWNSLLSSISPYDIPIKYIDGHSMVGEIEKLTPIVDGYDMSIVENLPFSQIKLGNNLTMLSVSTYIHEIVHSQTEGTKGYTDNYHNKEVISIFMEKLAASELDPNGNILKINETMRFRDLAERLFIVNDFYLRGNSLNSNYKTVLESSMYIESTLKASKLFDIYESERKVKNKRKLLYNIQDIFDGKSQVEDLLGRNNVTINNSQNLLLVKKRLKR